MSEIIRYAIVGPDNVLGPHEYDSKDEAIGAALLEEAPHAVLAVTYVFDDTDLAWTPDGGDIWPPADDNDEEER